MTIRYKNQYLYTLRSGVFGYRFFGFHPVFSLREDGIEHEGGLLPWHLISKVEDFDFFDPSLGLEASQCNETFLKIYYDGGVLKINSSILQKEDRTPLITVTPTIVKTAAYEFVYDFISKKVDPKVLCKGETLNEKVFRLSTRGPLKSIDRALRAFLIAVGALIVLAVIVSLINLVG